VSGFRGRTRRSAAGDVPYPLEGLVQDMRDLRLTLAADLHAAAAAVEDGATEVASDIFAADREELARFRRIAEMRMGKLQRLTLVESDSGSDDVDAPRWRRRVAFALPAVPLVGAMAVSAAAVTGALPIPGSHAHHAKPAISAAPASGASQSLQQLEAVVDDHQASAHDVIAAARALHRQLAVLIANTSNNPARAAEVAELLRMEQDMLLRAQPPGASVVLDATRRLAQQLVDTTKPLPKPAPTSTVLPMPTSTSSPKPHKSTSTSPSASPKQSTSPKPSSSASSSPDSDGGHIPAVP
jgi:hypothetical protein